MTTLAVHASGSGTPVVLVHGSLATGTDEWEAQTPLRDEGFLLLAVDRRGFGDSPTAEGEDFVLDAEDIAGLLTGGDAAHLVGHSYGGLSAMLAATRCPEQILSLTLLEPPTLGSGQSDEAVLGLERELRELWAEGLPDEQWLSRFLRSVGTDTLPPDVVNTLVPLVPMLRNGPAPWQGDLPLEDLASAAFPKLVVSGGHSRAFEAMCDDIASRIGASRKVVEGAGHEIHFTGPALNELLLRFWNTAESTPTVRST